MAPFGEVALPNLGKWALLPGACGLVEDMAWMHEKVNNFASVSSWTPTGVCRCQIGVSPPGGFLAFLTWEALQALKIQMTQPKTCSEEAHRVRRPQERVGVSGRHAGERGYAGRLWVLVSWPGWLQKVLVAPKG